jgi:hypothetical protein
VVLPSEKLCMQCHKEQKSKCSTCHTDVRKRREPTQRYDSPLTMSHAAHIERVKEDCTVCHKQLPNPVRTATMAPTMGACLQCHEHQQQYDDGKCEACHKDLRRYALKPVSGFTHAGNFVKEHMRPARAGNENCAKCHDQTFCTDCHASTVGPRVEVKFPDRVDRDFIHRNDFVSRHTIEAQADPVSCARCHGTSFCQNCHQAQNLTQNGTDPRSPHPAGYAFPGSNPFHGTDARRNIASCAACHDQGAQSNCVRCHQVGGIGGNPHPPSWTLTHTRDEIGGNGMCLICHR